MKPFKLANVCGNGYWAKNDGHACNECFFCDRWYWWGCCREWIFLSWQVILMGWLQRMNVSFVTGDIDGAAAEKHRMEEKQRAARKERKRTKEEWSPQWVLSHKGLISFTRESDQWIRKKTAIFGLLYIHVLFFFTSYTYKVTKVHYFVSLVVAVSDTVGLIVAECLHFSGC